MLQGRKHKMTCEKINVWINYLISTNLKPHFNVQLSISKVFINFVLKQVVCRELNYPDGRAFIRNSLGLVSYGSLTALGSVTNVSCTGHETDLASCPMNSTSMCGFEGSIIKLASVICYNKTVTEADLSEYFHLP